MSITLKNVVISVLAYLIGSSVVLSSVHAKDLASHQTDLGKAPAANVKIHADDVSAKAIGELHNHVDKTALKGLVKSVGDQTTLATGREQRLEQNRYQRSAATALMELSIIFRIAFARAFSF